MTAWGLKNTKQTMAHTAPTFGWDTVFAVPIDEVNAAIVKRKASPKKMSYTNKHAGFQLKADFGDWQVIPKGDGSLIRIAVPMKNVKGSYNFNGSTVKLSCADCVGIIQIKLNYLPHSSNVPIIGPDGKVLPPPAKNAKRHKLVARTKSSDTADPVAEFVTVVFNKDLKAKPSSALSTCKVLLETGFSDWCENHLEEFSHIFAVVDLNDEIATGKWSFCKPHTTSYAYVDRGDVKSSFLGVLCMTSNDPVPNVQQVSNFAVPNKSKAGFLISPRRFLLDMVKPSMTGVWPNLKSEDLEISSDSKILRLKSGAKFDLPQFTAKDGNTYTPSMSKFSLEIFGDELKIDSHTEVEVSAGIYATCTATYFYKIKLGKNKKGKQTIVYEQSRKPIKTTGHYHDEGIVILKDILTAISIVLGVLLMIVDPEAGLIVGAILVYVLVGQYEISNIELARQDDAPGLDDLSKSFTQPIVWTDTKDFKLKSAGMSESFQLGGIWNG